MNVDNRETLNRPCRQRPSLAQIVSTCPLPCTGASICATRWSVGGTASTGVCPLSAGRFPAAAAAPMRVPALGHRREAWYCEARGTVVDFNLSAFMFHSSRARMPSPGQSIMAGELCHLGIIAADTPSLKSTSMGKAFHSAAGIAVV
jgi:hypothetical protein